MTSRVRSNGQLRKLVKDHANLDTYSAPNRRVSST